jgi:hypothetical protein
VPDPAAAWLEAHAVHCTRFRARLSAAACAAHRENDPQACERCAGYATEAPTPRRLSLPAWWRLKRKPKEEDMGTKTVKIDRCRKCGEERKMIGRQLCSKCYSQEKTAGSLDANYPLVEIFGTAPVDPYTKPPAAETTSGDGAGVLAQELPEKRRQEIPATPRKNVDLPLPTSKDAREEDAIFLHFRTHRDEVVYRKLARSAELNRRSFDQEVLYQLERILALDGEGPLASAPSDRPDV